MNNEFINESSSLKEKYIPIIAKYLDEGKYALLLLNMG
jgi:hypothetical protein